jgi:hypothetical protein
MEQGSRCLSQPPLGRREVTTEPVGGIGAAILPQARHEQGEMKMNTASRVQYSPQDIILRSRKASGWYALICAFSAVNSVLHLAGGTVRFVVGLGVTQVVDAVLAEAQKQAGAPVAAVAAGLGVAINLAILGVLVVIWQLSKRGSATAYVIGMMLYLLDTLIFVLVRDWVGAGFHVFFLAMLWGGYGFVKQHRAAEQALLQPVAQPGVPASPV